MMTQLMLGYRACHPGTATKPGASFRMVLRCTPWWKERNACNRSRDGWAQGGGGGGLGFEGLGFEGLGFEGLGFRV